jgi:hypothetical protein
MIAARVAADETAKSTKNEISLGRKDSNPRIRRTTLLKYRAESRDRAKLGA